MTPAAARPSTPWLHGALVPFRTPLFVELWVASLASNFGTMFQTVGAAWLMTTLASSSDLVAFVQAATALPIMFLSVPAGAIADIWDRRALMLLAQAVTATTVALAWAYVVLRALHSAIHLSYNRVVHRLLAYAASTACVFAMWALLGAALWRS